MERNVGGRDRQARFLVGGLLVVAGLAVLVAGRGGPTGLLLSVMALAGGGSLLANAVSRRCLVNRLFGIDTCEEC